MFRIQDGGDRHLENRFFGHNSSTDCPISAKFCLRKQNGMPTKATWQKLQIFKIQDGGRPPFLKSLYRHISVKKSCATSDIEPGYSYVTKNWNFGIQDGGDRHLENGFFGHNSSTDCPISAKFCLRKQNGMPTKATWQKLQFLKSKMADGRHFENRYIAISQWKIVRF